MTKLYPNLQAKVQVLIENAHKKGLDVWIVQGMRTIEQQNELYEQGRTKGKKGKTVTNAKGGESYHNYGLAVDVVFHGSEPFYKTYPKLPKSRHIWTAITLVFTSCFITVLEWLLRGFSAPQAISVELTLGVLENRRLNSSESANNYSMILITN